MGEQIKFLLINPTAPLWQVGQGEHPKNSNVFRFSMLPSLYVAASMPPEVTTQILDEDVEPIDFTTDAQLIGISFMTFNAPRAYEIADKFRSLGKTVIFGGYHPTFMPEEAIQHADAICIGEAEGNIPKIIEDYKAQKLEPFYKGNLFPLENLPKLNRQLLKNGAYITLNALQATRGCRNHCDFCSVAPFNRHKLRTRPVEDVIAELNTLGKYVLFMDDNLTQDRAYAEALFTAMLPLKKKWFSQSSITIANDEELLGLAARSGCSGLFMGFESLSATTIDGWNKSCNHHQNYMQVVKIIHAKGIAIFGAFVFGSDTDTADIFAETLDFLLEANIETLQSTRLTPFPGTKLFEQFKAQKRITCYNWNLYDFFHVVYQPKAMSQEQLHSGVAWLQKQFYSRRNIARRSARALRYLPVDSIIKAVLPINFGYRTKLKAYGTFQLAKQFNIS